MTPEYDQMDEWEHSHLQCLDMTGTDERRSSHVMIFSSLHLRTFSSCWTVVSLHSYSTTLIDSAVCFTIILFIFTCLLLAF